MKFTSFIALVGIACGIASCTFGVFTLHGETVYAVPCFVMAIACWLFIWIARSGSKL